MARANLKENQKVLKFQKSLWEIEKSVASGFVYFTLTTVGRIGNFAGFK